MNMFMLFPSTPRAGGSRVPSAPRGRGKRSHLRLRSGRRAVGADVTTAARPQDDALAATLDALLARTVTRRKHVRHGLLGVLRTDGASGWQGAHGTLDESGAPAHTGARYPVASVTKLFTAVTVLRLVEQGRLTLRDRLVDILPAHVTGGLHVLDGVDRTAEITVEHLLGHTSGLPDYYEEAPSGQRSAQDRLLAGEDAPMPFEEVLRVVRDELTPHFAPQPLDAAKSKARYTDTSYQLLGAVIESVTGNATTGQPVKRMSPSAPLSARAATGSRAPRRPLAVVGHRHRAERAVLLRHAGRTSTGPRSCRARCRRTGRPRTCVLHRVVEAHAHVVAVRRVVEAHRGQPVERVLGLRLPVGALLAPRCGRAWSDRAVLVEDEAALQVPVEPGEAVVVDDELGEPVAGQATRRRCRSSRCGSSRGRSRGRRRGRAPCASRTSAARGRRVLLESTTPPPHNAAPDDAKYLARSRAKALGLRRARSMRGLDATSTAN
jgi:hypothetical protein